MRLLPWIATLLLLGLCACDSLPGKPREADRVRLPSEIMDLETLWGQNCAGCHGAEGTLGPARPLADPLFYAIASDAEIIRTVREGVSGTSMPSFATSEGGSLTDEQIQSLVAQMRKRWGTSAGSVTAPPSYTGALGNAQRGSAVYARDCARCHGADGQGGDEGASVVDGSYLALVSNQGLRSAVIFGRPDLGMPDYRGYTQGRTTTNQEVADVVAWLAAQRVPFPGQPYANRTNARGER